MTIIHGNKVDMICPFPLDQLDVAYQWTHAYPSLSEDDDSAASSMQYQWLMAMEFAVCTSYGLLRAGTTSGLIGMIYFEPAGTRNGYLHIAMARQSWGRGMADEAMSRCIRNLFETLPLLTRPSAAMAERNHAAQALAQRMGFTREGVFRDMFLENGVLRTGIRYGLTKTDWHIRQTPQ